MKGYELEITLDNNNTVYERKFNIEKISRKIIIPENTTMEELHTTIQKLFGFENVKDYEFAYLDIYSEFIFEYGPNYKRFCSTHENMSRIYVDRYFKQKISFDYEYDYSEEWCFTVEYIRTVEYNKYYATIINYKGKYNLIDGCGGIGSYEYLLNTYKNPPKDISKQDQYMLKKLKEFDLEKTQENLKSIFDMV